MASILIENNAPVMTIIINRPDVKNAVDGPTARELAEAFRTFKADETARVAVLWGAGGCFCAGADLKAIADPERVHRLSPEGDAPLGPSRMFLKKPVIAAISGYAVAGGLELACFCDLRVAEQSAVFGVFCRRWGVPLIDGGTIRLPRLIGLSRAMDLILTGRPVAADEAHIMGLANRVVADGQSREAAEALAVQIAKFPQVCMRNDRQSAYEQFDMDIETALQNEFQHGMDSLNSPEFFAGIDRYAKGRGRHGEFDK